MCGLRTCPRTDVDPPRVELPSGGGAYHLAAPGAITCSIQVFVAYLESAFWWVAASSHGVARSGRLGAVNRVTAYHLRQLELVRS